MRLAFFKAVNLKFIACIFHSITYNKKGITNYEISKDGLAVSRHNFTITLYSLYI